MENNLIAWVKRELDIKGWSYGRFSKASGLSKAYISAILLENRSMTLKFYKGLSKGFNEPLWNILIMAGEIDNVPEGIYKSEEIRVLLVKFGQLSPSGKDDLLNYLDWILKKENK